jgi:hypothetical protein
MCTPSQLQFFGKCLAGQKCLYAISTESTTTYAFLHACPLPLYDVRARKTRGVSHTLALPFTLKSILRQKKNYGDSNISPCKNIIFQESSYKNRPIIIT